MQTKIFHDGFDGHVKRSRERNAKRAKGERLAPERIFTFADLDDMLECLTSQRVRLCQTVRTKRMSITALAEELGRNRGSVTRDVKVLLKYGMLRLREEVNPGHGKVQIVEPVAERCEMRIEF